MTGWDITLDLVRKLAASRGEPQLVDPETWYRQQLGRPPEYSELLNTITKTPEERRGLLRPYFEPTPEEREEGLKLPTKAHIAVAKLASSGFIKLILTTNFDRLMESALGEHGVEPITLTTAEDIQSAPPFDHMNCCVVKLHGDYMEDRIRNTEEELKTYDPEMDRLLGRIFRDYGLIICGWSADWDVALRSALNRNRSRRYAVYWVNTSEPGKAAKKLITNLQWVQVKSDADSFFEDLQQKVEVLTAYQAPHWLTVAVALRRLKDCLSDRVNRIRLRDLVDEALRQSFQAMNSPLFEVGEPIHPNLQDAGRMEGLVQAYRDACGVLVEMGPTAGVYAEAWNYDLWQYALARLTADTPGVGDVIRLGWKAVPASMLLYSLGMGAVSVDNLEFLGKLFTAPIGRQNGLNLLPIKFLPRGLWFAGMGVGPVTMQLLRVNLEWMHDSLRGLAQPIIPDIALYGYYFEKLEVLMALSHFYHEGEDNRLREMSLFWNPSAYNVIPILQDIEDSISSLGDQSPYPSSGIAGTTHEDWTRGVEALRQALPW